MLQNPTNTWDIPEKYIIIIHSMEVVGWLDVEHLSIEGGGDQLIQRRTHRIITLLPSAQHQFALHSAQWKVNEHSAHCTDHIVHWTVHSAQGCTPSALQAHSQVYFEFTPSEKHLSASVDQLLLCVAYWHNSEDFKVYL